MGLTERRWFENEDVPENYEWALEDAVYNSRTNKKYDYDIPRMETIKIKRRISVKAIRCIACDAWECSEYDKDKYEAEIIEEAIGLCESCRKAIEWAKKQMEGEKNDT